MVGLSRPPHYELILALHVAVLACFGIGALYTLTPSLSVPRALVLPSYKLPLYLELSFVADREHTMEMLAPQPLRAAVTAALSRRLRELAASDACGFAWRVQSSLSLRSNAASGIALERPLDAKHRLRGLRATFTVQRGREGPLSSATLTAASSAHIAARALNTTDSSSAVNTLATLLHEELSGRACRLARSPHAWRPPARVSLLLMQHYAMPQDDEEERLVTGIRDARFARLDNLRGHVQDFVDACWPIEATPVHADTVLVGDGEGLTQKQQEEPLQEDAAARLIEDCVNGGPRCGNGTALTLGPEPPLRLLLYARAPLQQPLRMLDRHGRLLPEDAGFVLAPSGALMPWRDERSAPSSMQLHQSKEHVQMRASIVAQLRMLMGLPSSQLPCRQRNSTCTVTLVQNRRHRSSDVHWLEASALQLSCLHAHLVQARDGLRKLHLFARAVSGEYNADAIDAYARTSLMHMRAARRHSARGELDHACAQAAEASRNALEAVHHPSLNALPELPEQYWLTTWPPLFFPIATAILSEAFSWMRRRRVRTRRA